MVIDYKFQAVIHYLALKTAILYIVTMKAQVAMETAVLLADEEIYSLLAKVNLNLETVNE